MPFGDMANDLYIGVFVIDLMYEIEAAAVDILVWKLIQHIKRRPYSELFTKNVGTFRADTLTKFYVFFV